MTSPDFVSVFLKRILVTMIAILLCFPGFSEPAKAGDWKDEVKKGWMYRTFSDPFAELNNYWINKLEINGTEHADNWDMVPGAFVLGCQQIGTNAVSFRIGADKAEQEAPFPGYILEGPVLLRVDEGDIHELSGAFWSDVLIEWKEIPADMSHPDFMTLQSVLGDAMRGDTLFVRAQSPEGQVDGAIDLDGARRALRWLDSQCEIDLLP